MSQRVYDKMKVVPFSNGSAHIPTTVKLIGRVVKIENYTPELFYWVLGDLYLKKVLVEGKKITDGMNEGRLKHIYNSSLDSLAKDLFDYHELSNIIRLFGESKDQKHIAIAGTLIKAYRLQDGFDKDDKIKFELFRDDKRKV
jgi:hypothetical protein